jgi:cell shape-determining protein MreC
MENSVGKFKQMLKYRDIQQENEQLKARISELEAVLEQHNIHILDKNCWCKPEVITSA